MKISLSCLKDYIPINIETDELVKSLTNVGLEVDSTCNLYEYLKPFKVAKILKIEPHPDADKLSLCDVKIENDKVLKVVCGASNIKEGMKVPIALPGDTMPDGQKLKKSKIRGVKSEGMLLSAKELALSDDSSGILVLNDEAEIGSSINEALNLSDTLIEIDLTPNRADCLSIIGIAREVGALQDKKVEYPKIKIDEKEGEIDNLTSVEVLDELCPRYCAKLIFDITVKESPEWLKKKLLSLDLKPINNIVDITNFVMMEMGQPLHAYDYDLLEENRIVVKRACDKEKFTTLDEKTRELNDDMLMICDGKKSIGVAGVMGGLNTEINDKTKRVLLESAYFNPASIRKTSKKLSIHTEASHRFEREVDPEITLKALYRATEMIEKLGEGKTITGHIDSRTKTIKENKEIVLNIDYITKILGLSVTLNEVKKHLESIEFKVEKISDNQIKATIPSFRTDIVKPIDLVEEVARLSGYDKIPTSFPTITLNAIYSEKNLYLKNQIKNILIGYGFTETINYSFVNKDFQDKLNLPDDDERRNIIEIANPLKEEQSVMRTSLLPGIFYSIKNNISNSRNNLKLFETGKVFFKTNEEMPKEKEYLVFLLTGLQNNNVWYDKNREFDFYDIKGALDSFLKALFIKPEFKKVKSEESYYLRHTHSAFIFVNDKLIGKIGEVKSETLKKFEIKQKTYIAEIDLSTLLTLITFKRQDSPISKYPSIARDITLISDKKMPVNDILKYIESLNENLIEDVAIIDVYEGKPIPEGKKSISIRIIYRSYEKSLKDKAINKLHTHLTTKLIKEIKADLPPE